MSKVCKALPIRLGHADTQEVLATVIITALVINRKITGQLGAQEELASNSTAAINHMHLGKPCTQTQQPMASLTSSEPLVTRSGVGKRGHCSSDPRSFWA